MGFLRFWQSIFSWGCLIFPPLKWCWTSDGDIWTLVGSTLHVIKRAARPCQNRITGMIWGTTYSHRLFMFFTLHWNHGLVGFTHIWDHRKRLFNIRGNEIVAESRVIHPIFFLHTDEYRVFKMKDFWTFQHCAEPLFSGFVPPQAWIPTDQGWS